MNMTRKFVNHQFSENLWKILACSFCGTPLTKTDGAALCSNCQSCYEYADSGALDLRLQRPKNFAYEFRLGTPLPPGSGFDLGILSRNTNPQVDFSNVAVPHHLSAEMLSWFPKARNQDSLALDLGCGSTIHRAVCEHAGFEYVGLDYDSAEAPILGDAHALPFKDESFEFILSIAVLEHIRFPFVMMREAYRVLRAGGCFMGTVAFLEPFHWDSFYHHTHLGTYNSLKEGGFDVERIAPSDGWSVLVAQAKMGLFPKMPVWMSTSLVLPLQVLHKLWWRIGSHFNDKATDHNRIAYTTGAFTFIARRGAAQDYE